MNQQPPEKPNHKTRDGSFLEVHTIFRTIQGEGPFAGQRAVFIRLAGCNLQCPRCDTDYTSIRQEISAEDIVHKVRQLDFGAPGGLVVITGGEPFRQNLRELIWALLDNGYRVQIETNGTLYQDDLPYPFITIVCSPKTGSLHRKLLPHIKAYKYVISAFSRPINADLPDDGLPGKALEHTAAPYLARPHPGFSGSVYIQPEDDNNQDLNKLHLSAAISSVLFHGHTLCLQLHKIIGME
jgi:7-carboxy-7-deazaguanine synthase